MDHAPKCVRRPHAVVQQANQPPVRGANVIPRVVFEGLRGQRRGYGEQEQQREENVRRCESHLAPWRWQSTRHAPIHADSGQLLAFWSRSGRMQGLNESAKRHTIVVRPFRYYKKVNNGGMLIPPAAGPKTRWRVNALLLAPSDDSFGSNVESPRRNVGDAYACRQTRIR